MHRRFYLNLLALALFLVAGRCVPILGSTRNPVNLAWSEEKYVGYGYRWEIHIGRFGSGYVTHRVAVPGYTNPVEFSPQLSPDGHRVAVIEALNNLRVFALDVPEPGITGDDLGLGDYDVTSVSWSPDGSELAFTGTLRSNPPYNYQYIYVVDSNGLGPVTPLTDALRHPYVNNVSWSPYGDKIAFASPVDGGHLFTISSSGTQQRGTRVNDCYEFENPPPWIDPNPKTATPTWQPDGGAILYRCRSGVVRTRISDGYQDMVVAANNPWDDYVASGPVAFLDGGATLMMTAGPILCRCIHGGPGLILKAPYSPTGSISPRAMRIVYDYGRRVMLGGD